MERNQLALPRFCLTSAKTDPLVHRHIFTLYSLLYYLLLSKKITLKLRILRQNETNLFSHIVSENKELGSALDDSDSGLPCQWRL